MVNHCELCYKNGLKLADSINYPYFRHDLKNYYIMNIYVGNLSYGVDESQLKGIFEQYGEVSSVKIINDKFTGRSKGFGFVEMEDDDAARQAIEEMNGHSVDNRNMVVNEARPRTENRERRRY